MKKCVVYTTITKDYDVLKSPLLQNNDFDFICFSDDENLKSDFWQIKPIQTPKLDQTRKARYLKLHPHLLFPDYQYSIWVDGSLSIVNNLQILLDEVTQQSKLGVYAHAKRNSLYQAALNCIDKQKDDPAIIQKQMSYYKEIGYPENNGLVASGVLVRNHHNQKIINLMELWWQQIYMFSKRDQLSFNYACWEYNYQYYPIPKKIGDGRFFRRNAHKTSVTST